MKCIKATDTHRYHEQRADAEARFRAVLANLRAHITHEQCALIESDLRAQHKVELIIRLHELTAATERGERQSARLLNNLYKD